MLLLLLLRCVYATFYCCYHLCRTPTQQNAVYMHSCRVLLRKVYYLIIAAQLKARPRIYTSFEAHSWHCFPYTFCENICGASKEPYIEMDTNTRACAVAMSYTRSLFLFKFIINARNNETIQQNILWDALKQATIYIYIYEYIAI